MSMFDRQNLAAWMASDDPWLNRLAESVARRLADPALAAEDVKQRVLLGLLDGCDPSKVPQTKAASLSPDLRWALRRAAGYQAIDIVRRALCQKRGGGTHPLSLEEISLCDKALLDTLPAPDITPEESATCRSVRGIFEKTLASLDHPSRLVVRASVCENLSGRAIAVRYGISRDSVTNILRNFRIAMDTALADRFI